MLPVIVLLKFLEKQQKKASDCNWLQNLKIFCLTRITIDLRFLNYSETKFFGMIEQQNKLDLDYSLHIFY